MEPVEPSELFALAAQCFQPLLGQTQATTLLTQAVAQQRIAPAYVFAGPEGIGRSLAARCFALLLTCRPTHRTPRSPRPGQLPPTLENQRQRIAAGNHPDVMWIEATYQVQGKLIPVSQGEEAGVKRKTAAQIRLSQIREISQSLSRPPLEADRHIVILEQADTMAEAAANGLLKTLEEPGQATLILITPSRDRLLPTLISRCQQIPFQSLEPATMAQVLQTLGRGDLLNQGPLMAMAGGSPGAAIAAGDFLQTLDPALVNLAQQPPQGPRQALTLAKTIAQDLDVEQQIWLLNYLQHCQWHPPYGSQGKILGLLEAAKGLLGRSVQPRLVWEVLLLQWAGILPLKSESSGF